MSKTAPAIEEAILAAYLVSGNYAETARKFGVAKSTAWEIVHRLGGDSLNDQRMAARADLCDQAWSRIQDLLGLATPANFVGAKTSIGAEAARAAADLAKVAAMLEPEQNTDTAPPTEIHIHGNIMPPEQAPQPSPVGDGTTSTNKS